MIRVDFGGYSNSACSFLAYQQHAEIFGCKSAGLGGIPDAWTPKYMSVSRDLFDHWKKTGAVLASVPDVDRWLAANRAIASAGYIVRSSGVEESLQDRGRFLSLNIGPTAGAQEFLEAALAIFQHAAERDETTPLGLVLQVLMEPDGAGHLSNEVRLSPTRNQWQYEVHSPTWLGSRGLNSKFAARPDPTKPLSSAARVPHAILRSLGNWSAETLPPRCHIEWVVSRGSLWVVQLDLEWAEIDHGVDPGKLGRNLAFRPPQADAARVFTEYNVGSETRWKKLRNLSDFDFDSRDTAPRLYVATGTVIASEIGSRPALEQEIDDLTGGRAVIRMEIAAAGASSFNLPRTDTVNGSDAVEWLERQVRKYSSQVEKLDDIAFILHAFLPAHAGAWAYADPNQQIAYVDALWGLPDGLQVLPHDSYQIDVSRKVISSVKHRYKPRFLQEGDEGRWSYVDVLRSKSRGSTLSTKDAVEIGVRTAAIANKLGKRAQIMWFSGVPQEYRVGRNLPWFRARETVDPAPRDAPRYRPTKVASFEDLTRLPSTPITIQLNPEAELIRREDFLDAVIEVALARRLPVELQGSTLSHVFYRLFQAGVAVNPPNYASHFRTRQRQTFGKLVRDRVPDQIRAGGELALEARLASEDMRLALLSKLFEEALEFRSAASAPAVGEELSDLLEVVRSLATSTEMSWERLLALADQKLAKRGGFAERRVLLETSLPQPNSVANTPTEMRLHELDGPRSLGPDSVFFPFSGVIGGATSHNLDLGSQALSVVVRLEGRGIFVSIRDRTEDSGEARQLKLFEL